MRRPIPRTWRIYSRIVAPKSMRPARREVELAGRKFRIRREFLEDIAEQKLTAAIAALRRALIVFHSPRDTIVGIDNASRIFLAAKHPKSFISLEDADHLLTRRADARYVGAVLAAWASRYLPAQPPIAAAAIGLRATRYWCARRAPASFSRRSRSGRTG